MEILKLIKQKNKMLSKISKKKNQNSKADLLTAYKKIRNEIVEKTRQSKKIYYENYFSKYNSNSRKIWLGIKEIINIKGKKS